MKRSIFIFLFLLSHFAFTQAQNVYHKLIDTSCVWNYVGCYGPAPYYTTFYRFKADTVLNGHQYFSLRYSSDSTSWHNFNLFNQALLREDTILKKVYILSNFTDEGLLYDFDLVVGDSIIVKNTACSGDSITYHLTSVDSVQMSDLSFRKRFNFNYYYYYMIEGLGTFAGLLHPGCALVGNCENLVCYYQNGQVYFLNPSFSNCFSSHPNDYFNYIDTNKLWNYAETYNMGIPEYTTLFRFKKDTLINNTTYYIAESTYDSINWYAWDKYFREEDKKVFILHNGTESLLYDFKANVGDTLQIYHYDSGNPLLCPDTCLIKIMGIDLVNTDGLYRKRIHFQYLNCPNPNDYWIEGIGYQYSIVKRCFHSVGPPLLRLVCYYENDTLKYKNPAYTTCNIVWVNTYEISKQKTEKPVLKYLGDGKYDIESAALIFHLKIFSVSNKELINLLPNAYFFEFSLSHLPKGLYVLKMQTEKGDFVMKIVR